MLEHEVDRTAKLAGVLALTFLACQITTVLFVAIILGEFEPTDLRPTYDELAQHGFYAYVVPPSLVEHYGWREETSIWRWRKHCSLSQDNRFNPLRINYFNKQDKSIFLIELTKWGAPMDWRNPEERISLPFDSQWAKAGTLEMIVVTNEKRQTLLMTYEDWYGTPIYITSRLPLVDTLTLLHTLNYVGAPPDEAKPWTCGAR